MSLHYPLHPKKYSPYYTGDWIITMVMMLRVWSEKFGTGNSDKDVKEFVKIFNYPLVEKNKRKAAIKNEYRRLFYNKHVKHLYECPADLSEDTEKENQ